MITLLVLLAAANPAGPAQTSPAPTPTPTPAVAILIAKPDAAPPPQGGSLADVAKHIKLKLPANQPRVLTNESVKQLSEGVELTTSSAGAAAGMGAASPNVGSSEQSKKAKWQARYRSAVQRVRALESDVKSLEASVAGLERDFYAHDDPVFRDSTIKPNWDRALAKLQKTREELEEARKQPDEVLNAARRDGALPGWFRGLDSESAAPAPASGAPASGPAGRQRPTPTPTPIPPGMERPIGPS